MADLILVGIYRLYGRLFYFAEVLFYYTKLPIGINVCKGNSKEVCFAAEVKGDEI